MAAIFGPQGQGPTRINQVQINQSVLGYALAVLMGKGKIQQSILWFDGFSAKQVSATAGGKGFGGGKGGTEYVYSADVIAGLCNGGDAGIAGVDDVWSGQSWLSNTAAADTYTITGGTPVYTPTNASSIKVSYGVGYIHPYSGTFADLGSGGTVLSGNHSVAFAQVSYGPTPAAGTFSINPATNQYYFSPDDAGKTVQIYYSFALGIVKKQDIDLIPSGLTVAVGGSLPFKQDGGVTYYGPGPDSDKPLTLVSGTPTATGTYSVSGSAPATYRFAPGDVNKEILITYKIDNTASLAVGTATSLNFTLLEGTKGQSPAALLVSNFPGAALGYSGIALAAYFPMDLGYGAQIQQNVFEVLTDDAWGGGIVDCSPIQCILQVLTNKVWGLGAGAVPFPVSAIDNAPGGTWGKPGATGVTLQDSTASSWFAANGFFISPVMDRQDTAASLIGRWLEAGQCAAFMSEGKLKLVPYGDTSTAGNGVIWIAPSEFAAALDDTCFLQKQKGQDPVKPSSSPWQDAYNTVQISWNNRANQYAPEVTPESDQAAINRYGSRIEDPQTWDFITTLPAAVFAASMRVKRNVYTRNTYEFSLAYRYTYLEPMDVAYLTTSCLWSTTNPLGISNLPVRITSVVDNPDGTLDVTAEDYPFGVHQPTKYNKALAAGATQPNKFADPGNSEVVLFEATSRLTGFQGNQIWIGAMGTNADWGSCNVHVSMDGDTYKLLGTLNSPARLGILAEAFGSGSDPDTANSLVISLAENSSALESATTADADIDNTLCYVGGELISYSTAAVTGVNQCTAYGYIRRGRMSSVVAAHSAGALFMRLDDSIFKFTYDPSWAGKTIFLKFQSVNVYGNSAQDLAGLTATAFTIPGLNPGTVDASSGLVTSVYMPSNVASNVATNALLSSAYDSTTVPPRSKVYVNGPAGLGTAWGYKIGPRSFTYPAGTLYGLYPGDSYYIVFDTRSSTLLAFPIYDYDYILDDFYIVLGVIEAASSGDTSTGGGYTGGGTGGTGGTGFACTVEGTPLDTPSGPVDNREIKQRFDRGENVCLSGRYGPERVVSADWVAVSAFYRVTVGIRPSFDCSGRHMLRVAGHYQYVQDLPDWCYVETRNGYEHARMSRIEGERRVLRIHLAGQSHEYSSHGVMTHNIKPNSPSLPSPD